MACNAMWKLWKRQGSIPDNIVHTTERDRSPTIEILIAFCPASGWLTNGL